MVTPPRLLLPSILVQSSSSSQLLGLFTVGRGLYKSKSVDPRLERLWISREKNFKKSNFLFHVLSFSNEDINLSRYVEGLVSGARTPPMEPSRVASICK